jgi:hypothetical protein
MQSFFRVKKEVLKDSKEAQKFLKETASTSNETMTSSSGDSSTGGKRPGTSHNILKLLNFHSLENKTVRLTLNLSVTFL